MQLIDKKIFYKQHHKIDSVSYSTFCYNLSVWELPMLALVRKHKRNIGNIDYHKQQNEWTLKDFYDKHKKKTSVSYNQFCINVRQWQLYIHALLTNNENKRGSKKAFYDKNATKDSVKYTYFCIQTKRWVSFETALIRKQKKDTNKEYYNKNVRYNSVLYYQFCHNLANGFTLQESIQWFRYKEVI
jgi:hypothetical protein